MNQEVSSKKRIYAFGIDLFFIGIIDKLLLFTYLSFSTSFFQFFPQDIQSRVWGNLDQLRVPLIFSTYFSYFLLSLYIGNGQTLGKKFFQLKVVSKVNDELSFTEALTRSIGYLFCYISIFSFFSLSLFNKKRKGIPDWLSGTMTKNEDDFSKESINENEIITPKSQLDIFQAS